MLTTAGVPQFIVTKELVSCLTHPNLPQGYHASTLTMAGAPMALAFMKLFGIDNVLDLHFELCPM